MNSSQIEHLIAGVILGISIILLVFTFFTNPLGLIIFLPFIALSFGVYKYIKNKQYIKKKDTYEYFDKQFNERFLPLVDKMNERMIYFDNYFHLSIDEQMKHKKDVQYLHRFFAELNTKINNKMFDDEILKTYFNESFKDAFLNLHMHFDITFQKHPAEVSELYCVFFDDFDDFEKKRIEQHKEVHEYFTKNVIDKIKIDIDNDKYTLNEWIKKTNLSSGNCNKKEQTLHVLQILKKLYPNVAGIYVSLGNLYHICFGDSSRSIKYLEEAISLEPTLIEAYLSLTAIKFIEIKNIDEVLAIFNQLPKDIAESDLIIKQKAGILVQGGRYSEAVKVANAIANLKNREKALLMLEDYNNR